MEDSNRQPPPPSKQQRPIHVSPSTAWLLKGPTCFAYLISLLFAVLSLITVPLSVYLSADNTGHANEGEVILSGLFQLFFYIASVVTAVIGLRRVKRDSDLKRNNFNGLYLALITLANLINTYLLLFLWLYVLPGEQNGGCC
tara:strand:+ start:1143 stop:1568 length:426 start_codon:yes stop_codon:yes gene_type:complete